MRRALLPANRRGITVCSCFDSRRNETIRNEMTRDRWRSWPSCVLRMLPLGIGTGGIRSQSQRRGETVKPDRQQPNGMARTSCLPLLVARDLVENLHPLRADVTRKGRIKIKQQLTKSNNNSNKHNTDTRHNKRKTLRIQIVRVSLRVLRTQDATRRDALRQAKSPVFCLCSRRGNYTTTTEIF